MEDRDGNPEELNFLFPLDDSSSLMFPLQFHSNLFEFEEDTCNSVTKYWNHFNSKCKINKKKHVVMFYNVHL